MNKIKAFFLGHKGLLSILIVYLVFCFYFTSKINHFVSNSKYSSTAENSAEFVNVPLEENSSFSFKLEPKNSKWSGISIFFDKIDEELPAAVSMSISDNSNVVVYSYTLSGENLAKANGYYRFNFADSINAKHGEYTVTVFGTNINLKQNGQSSQAAYKLYGNLLKKFLVPFICVVMFVFLFAGAFIVYFVCIKSIKTEKLFLFGAIIFGLFFMFIMPPLTVGDECRHFDTAYDLSNKLLGIKNAEPGKMMKRAADLSIVPPDYMKNQNWTLFNYYEEIWPFVFKQLKQPQDYSLVSVYPYAAKLNSYFFMFLPSAIGITAGRLLKLNFLFTFLLGRLFNLAVFILLGYFALRKCVYGKTFFATFALAPMFLHQIASYSYDSVLFSLIFYFTVSAVSIIQEKRKISVKECIFLCISIFLFAASKVIYFPIAFLVFLFGRECFTSFKAKRTFLVCACLCLIFSFCFEQFYEKNTAGLVNVEQFTESASKAPVAASSVVLAQINAEPEMYSVKWILKHPFTYAYVLLNSLAERGDYYLVTAAGGFLGWEAIPMNKLLVAVLICLFAFQVLRKDSQNQLNVSKEAMRLKIFSGIVFVFISGAVFTALVGAAGRPDFANPFVGAVQGRYFLPALPFLYFVTQYKTEPDQTSAQNILSANFLILVMFAIDLSYRIVGIY